MVFFLKLFLESFGNSFGNSFWHCFWNCFWNCFRNSFGNCLGLEFLCMSGFVGVQVLHGKEKLDLMTGGNKIDHLKRGA